MRRELLLAPPLLLAALLFQTAVVGRVRLLQGSADLMLLVVAAWALQERARGAWIWGAAGGLLAGLVSDVGWFVYLAGYLAAVATARLFVNRIWQAPLLAMFAATLAGTLALLILSYLYLAFFVTRLPFPAAFTQVILPSSLLNLLLAIPVHAALRDLADRLYPERIAP